MSRQTLYGTSPRTAKHARTAYECSLEVQTDSALERPRTKDVRWATSPFDARVPGERCVRGIRELGPPRFFRRPRVAGRSPDVPPLKMVRDTGAPWLDLSLSKSAGHRSRAVSVQSS
jgi:hypothetical protein